MDVNSGITTVWHIIRWFLYPLGHHKYSRRAWFHSPLSLPHFEGSISGSSVIRILNLIFEMCKSPNQSDVTKCSRIHNISHLSCNLHGKRTRHSVHQFSFLKKWKVIFFWGNILTTDNSEESSITQVRHETLAGSFNCFHWLQSPPSSCSLALGGARDCAGHDCTQWFERGNLWCTFDL